MYEKGIVYKVVSLWDVKTQTGYSACIHGGAYRLKYTMKKKTRAIDGTVGIVCFADLKGTRSVSTLKVKQPAVILKCRHTGEALRIPEEGWIFYDVLTNIRKVVKSIFGYKKRKRIGTMYGWANPSYCVVDSVTPIECVGTYQE